MSSVDSKRQLLHFETVHDKYVEHYYDSWSMRYREEFILPFIYEGLDLNDKSVAEIACGSGHNSHAIRQRFPRVSLTGFDISPSACTDYSRNVGSRAVQADLTKPMQIDAEFDLVFVIGGLHHCIADLPQTLRNAAALLKPGGRFVMMEPNSEFFLEAFRNLWYRLDRSFDAQTEHALNHDEIAAYVRDEFLAETPVYFGGPAYFGVLNSMILRIPLWMKPILSPPLISLERLWNRLPGRRAHNVFIGRWIKPSNGGT